MRNQARWAMAAAAMAMTVPLLVITCGPAAAATLPGCPTPKGQRITNTPATFPKTVSLTFDDGPNPDWTPQVLAALARHHVHGTFFMIGDRAAQHPDLLQKVVDAGHVIGNHTWNHPTAGNGMYDLTRQQLVTELDPTSAMIRNETGRPVCFFRAPQGKDQTATIHELARARGMTVTAFYSASDYQQPGQLDPTWVSLIEQRLENLGNHPILLMHDGGGFRGNTVAALDAIITWYAERGYVFTDPAGRPFPGGLPADAKLPSTGWAIPPDWTPPPNGSGAGQGQGQVDGQSEDGSSGSRPTDLPKPGTFTGSPTAPTAPAPGATPSVKPTPQLTKLAADSTDDPLAAQQLMNTVTRYLMVFSAPPS